MIVWREVLECDDVSVTADFFELGGNSLRAFALLHRIAQIFGVSLPVTTLAETPTIQKLAGLIEQRLRQQRGSSRVVGFASAFQVLAGSQDRQQTPLFAIHGGGGGSLFYRPLVDFFPSTRAFFAIEVDGLATSHEASIQESARKHLEEIRKIQPRGPYIFMGYSTGGVVAWEMCHQASQDGDEVEAVIMIDSANPQVENAKTTLRAWATHAWSRSLGKPLPVRLWAISYRLWLAVKKRLMVRLPKVTKDQVPTYSDCNLPMYHPAPLPEHVRVVLVRAEDDGRFPDQLGWESLSAEPITVIPTTGEHHEVFHPEYLRSWAQPLSVLLAKLP